MIAGKKVLAIIPARGGSKGVPRKNIRDVAGKPLIAWSIEAGKRSRYIDRLMVSTEDAEIAEVARRCGAEVPFLRPAHLAKDDTPGIDPVLHAIAELPGYDLVVLLQPTSPLRDSADIDGCLELCLSTGASGCVSVTEPDKSPYWMYTVTGEGTMRPLLEPEGATRRQDLPTVWALNGAVYVARVENLVAERSFVTADTRAYPMPKDRSADIDTEIDLVMADLLLRKRCAGE